MESPPPAPSPASKTSAAPPPLTGGGGEAARSASGADVSADARAAWRICRTALAKPTEVAVPIGHEAMTVALVCEIARTASPAKRSQSSPSAATSCTRSSTILARVAAPSRGRWRWRVASTPQPVAPAAWQSAPAMLAASTSPRTTSIISRPMSARLCVSSCAVSLVPSTIFVDSSKGSGTMSALTWSAGSEAGCAFRSASSSDSSATSSPCAASTLTSVRQRASAGAVVSSTILMRSCFDESTPS